MKRIFLLTLLLVPALVYAQKPKVNKALSLWREGNLAEAKEIIDLASTYEKTKDDSKTWYYRGLIYSSIDTTSDKSLQGLHPNPLKVAVESFKKSDELHEKGKEMYISIDATNPLPITKSQQMETLANYYLNDGIKLVQTDEPDYQKSVDLLSKSTMVFEAMEKYPNDTLAYWVMGFAANGAQKPDLAIEAMDKYIKRGGTAKDPYLIKYQIYNDQEDKENALKTVQAARKAFPEDVDFARLEIGLLIDLKRVEEAKVNLEKAVAESPDDKTLHFFLAYTNQQLDKEEEALKHFKEALRIDPNYFEAQYHMSLIYLEDVDILTKQINDLGISAADEKKKRTLYQERVKMCDVVIPMLEKLEKMEAPDTESKIDVLEKLQLMYYYVADDTKENIVKNKLKALGAIN